MKPSRRIIIAGSFERVSMSSALPEITLVRHGETAWSLSGQHTGRSDIPLTENGEAAAVKVADRLQGLTFDTVWSSPSQRASRTCELAGFGARREIKDDLAEWDYGAYEGLKTKDIHATRPGWHLFRDGAPDGEAVADVGARADRIIAALRERGDRVLIFSSSHFLRVLGARWIGMPPEDGARFILDTTSISVLGYEHNLGEPVIRRWNQK
jgi:probable phosphoglycerate mutase